MITYPIGVHPLLDAFPVFQVPTISTVYLSRFELGHILSLATASVGVEERASCYSGVSLMGLFLANETSHILGIPCF